jgi:hypothetical protein
MKKLSGEQRDGRCRQQIFEHKSAEMQGGGERKKYPPPPSTTTVLASVQMIYKDI